MSLYGLARNWWWIVLRGLFAVVFLLAAYYGTYSTLIALVMLFGVYALVDGLVVIFASLTHGQGARPWWIPLTEGLLGISAGILAFLSPGLAAIGLVYLIVGWAAVSGTLVVFQAIWPHGALAKAGLLAVGAALTVVLGTLLMLWPQPMSLALFWLAAAYGLVFGLLQIGLGFRIRSWQKRWMRPMHLLPTLFGSGWVTSSPNSPQPQAPERAPGRSRLG